MSGTKQISWLSGRSAAGRPELARARPHLGLPHAAERKEHALHLVLRQPVQEVALVLAFVNAFFQKKAGRPRVCSMRA